MGERVPKSYLALESLIERLRVKRKEMPMIPIDELMRDVSSLDLLKRALGLLSLWGECVF